MKPRIGFGIDPNSDTTSTNMTQQLLLEHQKQNEDKTNQLLLEHQNKNDDKTNQLLLEHQNMNDDRTNKMFLAYNANFVNGMKLYHNNYIEPLKNDIHILKSDFDSYTNTYPTIYQQSPLPERYTNELLNNDDNNAMYNTNNNKKIEYDVPEINLDNIYNSKNADNFDDKEGNPILKSNNADNFLRPPFDEYFNPNNTNLKNDNDTNLKNDLDEQSDDDENDRPKNDAVLEEKTFPILFSQIKDPKILHYINKSDPRLGETVPSGIGGEPFNKLLKKKLKESKITTIRGLRFDIPARFFTEEQIKNYNLSEKK